jgi:hypothetical protein
MNLWKLKTKFHVERHSWFPWVMFWKILKYIIVITIIGAMAWLVIVDQCSC